jgi:hypothetical protein
VRDSNLIFLKKHILKYFQPLKGLTEIDLKLHPALQLHLNKKREILSSANLNGGTSNKSSPGFLRVEECTKCKFKFNPKAQLLPEDFTRKPIPM